MFGLLLAFAMFQEKPCTVVSRNIMTEAGHPRLYHCKEAYAAKYTSLYFPIAISSDKQYVVTVWRESDRQYPTGKPVGKYDTEEAAEAAAIAELKK